MEPAYRALANLRQDMVIHGSIFNGRCQRHPTAGCEAGICEPGAGGSTEKLANSSPAVIPTARCQSENLCGRDKSAGFLNAGPASPGASPCRHSGDEPDLLSNSVTPPVSPSILPVGRFVISRPEFPARQILCREERKVVAVGALPIHLPIAGSCDVCGLSAPHLSADASHRRSGAPRAGRRARDRWWLQGGGLASPADRLRQDVETRPMSGEFPARAVRRVPCHWPSAEGCDAKH